MRKNQRSNWINIICFLSKYMVDVNFTLRVVQNNMKMENYFQYRRASLILYTYNDLHFNEN